MQNQGKGNYWLELNLKWKKLYNRCDNRKELQYLNSFIVLLVEFSSYSLFSNFLTKNEDTIGFKIFFFKLFIDKVIIDNR